MSPRGARRLVPAGVVLLLLSAGVAACAPAGPAAEDDLAAAAARWGSAPQYVLTTAATGFDAVPMAAGAYGTDGFSLIFSGGAGGTFLLTATGDAMSADDCATGPVRDTSGGSVDGPVTCTVEGELFHRRSGEAEEFVVVHDGVEVRVSGRAADRDSLREAAEHVRVPTDDELAELVSEAPPAQEPVERGDLPPGDGAPDNSVGLGG